MQKSAIKLFSLVLLAAFTFCLWPVPACAAPVPDTVAKAAILIDAQNGQVLWAKNEHEHMYPASITKILTALIAIKKGNLNAVVTIPRDAVGVEGSSIGLQYGEHLTLKDLLYAMMLASANDCAVAIADYIAGSVPGFARMMNEEARELGAVDSHFANPDGLYNQDHYVSAYDMALITQKAMQNPVFRQIVGTQYYEIPRENPQSQRDLVNHNRMLWIYPGAVGVKTGYIIKSGETLVVAADRNGRELIAVVLDSLHGETYTDAASMLNYGFDNFSRVQVIARDEILTTQTVRYGTSGVQLSAANSFYYDFPVSGPMQVDKQVDLFSNPVAPVEKGEQMGAVILSAGGKEIGRVDLIAQNKVGRELFADWIFWVILLLVALSVILFYLYGVAARKSRYFQLRRH